MSTGSVVENHDRDDAHIFTTPCPEGSVLLHQVCDNCQQFFDNWKPFDIIANWGEVSYDEWEREFKLCTISQLLQSQQTCHFYCMVLSWLGDQQHLDPTQTVILHAADDQYEEEVDDEEPGYMLVYVVLQPDPEHQCDACFYIKAFNVASDDALSAPGKAPHVPRQAKDNLGRIEEWLYACRMNHKACSTWCSSLATSRQRPTRLLELSSVGVRLRCNTQNMEDIEYVALSHMWGEDSSQQLRLTMSRIQEFHTAIPWNELPDLFIEALRITRRIGFSYLWIDSLCIVQDSTSDWTTQASTMSTVYKNAVCSIAFLFPPGDGFLQHRTDARAISPCAIRQANSTRKGLYIAPLIVGSDTESRMSQRTWPLFSRAWTFQENLLSPRTILYGHQTIMWECVEKFSDELCGTWLPAVERDINTALNSPRHKRMATWKERLTSHRVISTTNDNHQLAELPRCPDYVSNWYELINEYRRRALTVASDRVMAFAGVAHAFQVRHGLTYLAGTWAEDMPHCLLWSTEIRWTPYDKRKHEIQSELVSPSVPSWSWFSSPISVHRYLNFNDTFRFIPTFSAQLIHFQWPESPINKVPQASFHDFAGLRITLALATFNITALRIDVLDSASLHGELALGMGVDSSDVHIVYHRDDSLEYKEAPTTIVLALLVEGREPHGRFPGEFFNRCEGLALSQQTEDNTWKRIGHRRLTYNKKTSESRAEELDSPEIRDDTQALYANEHNPEANARRRSGEESMFLRMKGAKRETLTLV